MAKKKGGGSTLETKEQANVAIDLPIPESKLPQWSFNAVKQLIEENDPENSGKGGKKAKPKKGEVALDLDSLKYVKNIELPEELKEELAEWRPLNRLAEVTRRRFPKNPFNTKSVAHIESGELNLDEIKAEEQEGDDIDEKIDHTNYILEGKQKENRDALQNYCQLPTFVDRGYNESFRAFFSALVFIEQHAKQIIASQPGHYLWELIYPKADSNTEPTVSSFGSYIVKLYVDGDWRLIAIDNQFPFNKQSKVIFPQTSNYEFWPTILFKALLAAAGEKHEQIVYNDPLFIIQSLLGPYLPEKYPTSNTLSILKQVNLSIQENQKSIEQATSLLNRFSTEDAAKDNPVFNINESEPIHPNYLMAIIDKDIDEAIAMGLKPNQAYIISKCAYANNKCLLQLISSSIDFEGEYSYKNNEIWTAEFEEAIQFSRQDHLQHSIASDFWLSLDELSQFSTSLYRLHHVSHLSSKIAMFGTELKEQFYIRLEENTPVFLSFQHLTSDPAEIIREAQAEKAKGKKEKGGVQPTDDGQFAELSLGDTSSIVSLQVEMYDWKYPSSYFVNQKEKVTLDREQLVRLENLDVSNLYRVTIGNRTQRTCVKCLSEKPVTIGNIEDVLRASNEIQYQEEVDRTFELPNDDQTTILFIKKLNITGETPLKIEFSPSQQLMKNIQLSLTNISDNGTIKDTIGVISIPNVTAGTYLLSGLYKGKNSELKAPTQVSNEEENVTVQTEENEQEKEENLITYNLKFWNKQQTVEIEDIATSSTIVSAESHGIYSPSSTGELFRYYIWVGEDSYANMTLKLNMDIPTSIRIVNHEDNVLQELTLSPKDEHVISKLLQLSPSDKKSASFVCVTATLDEQYNKFMLKRQQRLAGEAFSVRVQEETEATELPDETLPPQEDDKKKAAKKAPPKKKKGEAEIGERVTKIPAKQTEIDVIESIPSIAPPSITEGEEAEKSELTEGDFDLISVMYSLQVNSTTPNMVVEKVDLRAEKLAKAMEIWTEEDPERLTKSATLSAKLQLKQQIQANISNESVPSIPTYPHDGSSFPTWLNQSRGSLMNQYVDEPSTIPSEPVPYSSEIWNDRVSSVNSSINQFENSQTSLAAKRESTVESSYQLEIVHEKFLEEANGLKSTLETSWSTRATYHQERQEEAHLAAEEEARRQAEAAKAAKKKK